MTKRFIFGFAGTAFFLAACVPPRLLIKEHVSKHEVWEVAVMPFVSAPNAPGSGEYIAGLFANEAIKLPQYNVIEKGLVDKTLQTRGLAGKVIDTETALSLGDELGADGVLLGEVVSFRARRWWVFPPADVTVNVRFVEVKTGHLIWTATHQRNYGTAHMVSTLFPFPPTMALSLLYSPSTDGRAEQVVRNVVWFLSRSLRKQDKLLRKEAP